MTAPISITITKLGAMDGMNSIANRFPQGQGAPALTVGVGSQGQGNQANPVQHMAAPIHDVGATANGANSQGNQGVLSSMNNTSLGGMDNNPFGAMNNSNALGALGGMNNNALGGMNSNALGSASGVNDMSALLGNPNMNSGGVNPNDINSVMNAVLMNNALQQQPQPNAGMEGGVNPLLLQTMMNQGVLGASGNTAAAPSMGGANMMAGGVNNLLGQQSPAAATLGAVGTGNLNAAGNTAWGIGMDNGGSGNNSNGGVPTAGAPSVMDNANAPIPASNNAAAANDANSNDLLAQQMLAQGLNPMMLLSGMGGMGGMGGIPGMGQNQLPMMMAMGVPVAANPLGALALGMNGLGSFPAVLGNNANLGADATARSLVGNNLSAALKVAPHPNALFAFGNNQLAIPQALKVDGLDGALKPIGVIDAAVAKASKKQMKRMKVKGKPKRPLSAYNFFFREERSRILDSLPKGDRRKKKKRKKGDDGDNDEKVDQTDIPVKKEPSDDNGNAEKGDGEKDYDQVGDDGKKIPHGKIGFENLAKLIGKRWQELDAAGMEKYKAMADQDMTRYKKEMEAFLMKEAQGGIDGDLNAPTSLGATGLYPMLPEKKEGDVISGQVQNKKAKLVSGDAA